MSMPLCSFLVIFTVMAIPHDTLQMHMLSLLTDNNQLSMEEFINRMMSNEQVPWEDIKTLEVQRPEWKHNHKHWKRHAIVRLLTTISSLDFSRGGIQGFL